MCCVYGCSPGDKAVPLLVLRRLPIPTPMALIQTQGTVAPLLVLRRGHTRGQTPAMTLADPCRRLHPGLVARIEEVRGKGRGGDIGGMETDGSESRGRVAGCSSEEGGFLALILIAVHLKDYVPVS